jgi:RNase P subunit RPR2
MIASSTLEDHLSITCRRCQKIVRSRRELRSVELARTRLVVSDVMVDVCHECGHMIAIAPEGVAQLREAGVPK